MEEIWTAYEKWYNVTCKRENDMYDNMDVQAMYLLFRSGWLAKSEHYEKKREIHLQNEYVNQRRRFDD